MRYAIAYLAAFLIFGLVDLLWLGLVFGTVFKNALSEIMAPSIRIIPAVIFYLMFPIGLVIFCILPALKQESMMQAALLGLLFGAIAYATYDLTNFATLKVWSLQIAVIDIAWGGIASAIASAAAYYIVGMTTRPG